MFWGWGYFNNKCHCEYPISVFEIVILFNSRTTANYLCIVNLLSIIPVINLINCLISFYKVDIQLFICGTECHFYMYMNN